MYGVIEQFMEKYAQYADLFAPILDTHIVNAQIWLYFIKFIDNIDNNI